MRKVFLSLALLIFPVVGARADLIVSTSSPPGMPLSMSAGSLSGSMFVTVVSDNSPNDVMAAWQFQLEIIPEGGAAGTLTFQDPATGTAPNPTNYIFATGLGIATTNTGSALSANDFDLNGGTAVPGGPGANLLQMDFFASSDASGLFGVYAVRGAANTEWTDSNANTQFFSNVPDGTGAVLIGEVDVTPAGAQTVPEPNALTLLWTGTTVLIAWGWRRKRKQAVALSDQDVRTCRLATPAQLGR